MAAKSQEELKKKAAMIAEEAKTTAKRAAKEDLEVNEEVEESISVKQSDEGKKEALAETISEMNNNAKAADKKQVTEESANEFKEHSDEEDKFLRRSISIPPRRAMKKIFEHEEIIGDE